MLPNNQIHSTFSRPDKSLIDAFKGIPVANIGDVMNRNACLSPQLRPLNDTPLLGSALTVKTRAGDILIIHKAIDLAQPGDILVIDGQGDLTYAILGELMTTLARKKGVAGAIVNGSVRDVAALRALTDFPVYAAGISPNGPLKISGGEIGTTISCAGQSISAGDIVIGDADGVVVVNPQCAESIATLAKQNMLREQGIYESLNKGNDWPRPWVDDILKQNGCEGV